jgi:hypothetical protein
MSSSDDTINRSSEAGFSSTVVMTIFPTRSVAGGGEDSSSRD